MTLIMEMDRSEGVEEMAVSGRQGGARGAVDGGLANHRQTLYGNAPDGGVGVV